MDWIENYSDYDELKESRFVLFFKENHTVQAVRLTWRWFAAAAGIAGTVIGLYQRDWLSVLIGVTFPAYQFAAHRAMKNRFFAAGAFLAILVLYILFFRQLTHR